MNSWLLLEVLDGLDHRVGESAEVVGGGPGVLIGTELGLERVRGVPDLVGCDAHAADPSDPSIGHLRGLGGVTEFTGCSRPRDLSDASDGKESRGFGRGSKLEASFGCSGILERGSRLDRWGLGRVPADEPAKESFGMVHVGLYRGWRLARRPHLGLILPEQIHEFVVGPGLVSHGQDATSGTRGGREVHGPPDSVESITVVLSPGSRARTCEVGS